MDVHKLGHGVFLLLYFLLVVTSLASYNSAPLLILRYAGWILLLFGALFLLSERARRGNEGLIKTGVYSPVRHPEFLGHVFVIVSMIFFAQTAISFVTGVALLLMLWIAIVGEERKNIDKFGKEYVEYMKDVPRLNIIIGIIRRMRAI